MDGKGRVCKGTTHVCTGRTNRVSIMCISNPWQLTADNKNDTVLLLPYFSSTLRFERIDDPVGATGTLLKWGRRRAFLSFHIWARGCWANAAEC